MRLVWKAGDRDGDSSAHVVERSMNLVRGHPTWRIFIDEIPVPIQRGSKEEPPHYCYLDDRACYTIYCSKAYSNEELRKFWPWDFNHQANIKQGRLNRGHAAYLDDSYTELAKGRLRAKNQWYTFHGAPDVGSYAPLRPKKDTHMEELVAQEYAEKAEGDKSNGEDPDSEPAAAKEPATPSKNKTPEKSPSPTKTVSPSKRMSTMKLGNDTPTKLSPTKLSPTKLSPLKRRQVTPTESESPTKRAHTSKGSKPFRTSSGSEGDVPSLFE
jgi:hypothetical protein